MISKKNSSQLFSKAQNFIPGGVNSPVRAFRAVGGDPVFIKSARGAFMFDEDGNKFVDLINSWGPMVLGHGNEAIEEAVVNAAKRSLSFGAPNAAEVEIAELIIEMVPSVEKVRMVNSGTEATMSAIRLARGFTGKEKIIKFIGCYHGHGDSFLIAAGSGAATMGVPDSPGVTKGTALDTLNATYNDIESVQQLVDQNKGKIAALIIEPIAGNMGCVLPSPQFLEQLREICTKEGIVLIFDEVMTGFRVAKGGAQELYNVMPDLTTMGKIIGGGMPVGAYGGKKEIMDFISPQGPVYQAGTLSGNPVAMAAGLVMLHHLNDNPSVYTQLNETTTSIVNGIKLNLKELNLNYTINHVGSMFSLFFTDNIVTDFESAKTSNLEIFSSYFNSMLEKGVYLAPSQYETLFVSTAITNAEVASIVEANKGSLLALV
ncbi:glutamate-1-semialdehyde 2,1-aminomutase [Reichenbachiella sp. MALMAid0571]|uniref:glutamate-1-semialdehyde 2,1-aminomutase n=1 Tax=Reichenbachiella sp. MALMAid0571 TaxID=3143939 RepID=UPI0032DF05CF